MKKICFDCLNCKSGLCDKHKLNLEGLTTFTATSTTMTKDDIIEWQEDTIKGLTKKYEKSERDFMLLLFFLPLILMAMILFVKSSLILFIGFIIFWIYFDSSYKKLK